MSEGEYFRITGKANGSLVTVTFQNRRLTSSDPVAIAAIRALAAASEPLKPRPHIDLTPDLSNRAFTQYLLSTQFFSVIESIEEDPPFIFDDDVE